MSFYHGSYGEIARSDVIETSLNEYVLIGPCNVGHRSYLLTCTLERVYCDPLL